MTVECMLYFDFLYALLDTLPLRPQRFGRDSMVDIIIAIGIIYVINHCLWIIWLSIHYFMILIVVVE